MSRDLALELENQLTSQLIGYFDSRQSEWREPSRPVSFFLLLSEEFMFRLRRQLMALRPLVRAVQNEKQEMTTKELTRQLAPYLWPKGDFKLKTRVVSAVGLLLAAKVGRCFRG